MEYNRLTFIEEAGSRNRKRMWKMQCECGNVIITSAYYVRTGKSRSCGCGRRDAIIEWNKHSKLKHGHSKNKKRTLTFRSWESMRQRCNNPNATGYKHWGGRGIRICERWSDYENFLNDMGERPSRVYSLDRIDINGDYCPENCEWVTKSENSKRRFK